MKGVYARAPAKLILLGEHFVVHGSHAVSAAIDLFIEGRIRYGEGLIKVEYIDRSSIYRVGDRDPIPKYVEYLVGRLDIGGGFDIELSLGFPESAGLGSSASMAALLTILLYRWAGMDVDRSILYSEAGVFERMIHGNPSGVDLSTIVEGGVILFRRGLGVRDRIIPDLDGISILIVDSGVRRSTGDIVANVSKYLKGLDDDLRRMLISYVDSIVLNGWSSLKNSDMEGFGTAIRSNHYMLRYIGVYREEIDRIIDVMMGYDILGCKVTGAGGGGCVYCIAYREVIDELAALFRGMGYRVYTPNIYVEPLFSS